ncbi:heme peroxidase [Lentinula raphanica]|nr:heme peroxidase [Lentinula raphanica]
MSTHNVDDGTGGLDASIQYELNRPQNVGRGMVDSLTDFGKSFNVIAPFFGMADTMALGAILGVAACGGPLIPFSAGRIDATEAGPATVPEPQQDLASHTESFRRQGFTPTEMISLVACGHTLGGVRQVDFPLVVVDSEDVLQTFDSTINFDNAVVLAKHDSECSRRWAERDYQVRLSNFLEQRECNHAKPSFLRYF